MTTLRTDYVYRYGNKFKILIPEIGFQPGFDEEYRIDELDRARNEIRENQDLDSYYKLSVFRKLDHIERDVRSNETETIQLAEKIQQEHSETLQVLFAFGFALVLSAIVLAFLLWGMR